MPWFRKRPVEVEAHQWMGGPLEAVPIINWILAGDGNARYHEAERVGFAPYRPDDINAVVTPEHIAVRTLEGTMRVTAGDWVIRGTAGEFYPCKPEIFAETYDPVE